MTNTIFPKKYVKVDEIRNDIERIKQAADDWYTNIYMGNDILQKLIAKKNISGIVSNKTSILVANFQNTTKLYFFTVDFDDFVGTAKKILPGLNCPVSVEIFADSRNMEQISRVQKSLNALVFKHHATQYRLTKLVQTNNYGEIDPKWYATESDCE